MITQDWQVAVHEAGHAACAVALGFRITRVDAFAEGGGNVSYDAGTVADPLDRALRCAAVAWAGPIAEAALRGVEPEQLGSFAADALSAWAENPYADEEQAIEFVAEAVLLADELIRNETGWAEVERIARALARERQLTHAFFEGG